MKNKRFIAIFLILSMTMMAGTPVFATLNDLGVQLQSKEIQTAPCVSGQCQNSGSTTASFMNTAPSCNSGGGSGGGFLSGIVNFFKQLFQGIASFFQNIFGGGNSGGNNGGNNFPPVDNTTVYNPPVNPPTDNTTISNPPIDNTDTPVDNTNTTTNPPVDNTDTDNKPPVDDTDNVTTVTSNGKLPIKVDVRNGGKDKESNAYNWARGAVQPRTNDATVLRHEAVHYINGQLIGSASWTNLDPNVSRAFYLWGENKYWVIPNTSVRKNTIEQLVPTHLTSSHKNYFHNFDFGSRDALHIIEDLSAEISSGEKSHLLFDMIIFSSALGLKLEQLDAAGTNKYWSSNGGAIYRGTIKTFFEKAAMAKDSRMIRFISDSNAKSSALRAFLKRCFGGEWTKKVLGF